MKHENYASYLKERRKVRARCKKAGKCVFCVVEDAVAGKTLCHFHGRAHRIASLKYLRKKKRQGVATHA